MRLRAVRQSSYDSPAKSSSLARLMRDLYMDSLGVVITGTSFVGAVSVAARVEISFKEAAVSDTQTSSLDNND